MTPTISSHFHLIVCARALCAILSIMYGCANEIVSLLLRNFIVLHIRCTSGTFIAARYHRVN